MGSRKSKWISASFVAALTICITIVSISAMEVDPPHGYYIITNRANQLELSLDNQSIPVLQNAESFTWHLRQGDPSSFFHIVTTLDGRLALAYDVQTNQLFTAEPDVTDISQRWLFQPLDCGGYHIRALDRLHFSPQNPVHPARRFLQPVSSSAVAPGAVTIDYLDYTDLFVWNVTATPNQPPPQQWDQVVLQVTMDQLRYTVDGIPHYFDVAPFLDASANRSMIPMRFIAEAFGATVYWDSNSRTQHITMPGLRSFTLTEGVPLPGGMGTPVLINDRFFVPLRFVSEELGATVTWDSETRTNTISFNSPNQQPRPPVNQVVLQVTMNQLRYTVNGTPHYFDVAPFLDTRENRSMIPMRFIAEAFGATVTWDNSTRTQHISLDGMSFSLVEGVPLPLGMGTPVIINDRFFVPLRFVSLRLGGYVTWDERTQTNTITYTR